MPLRPLIRGPSCQACRLRLCRAGVRACAEVSWLVVPCCAAIRFRLRPRDWSVEQQRGAGTVPARLTHPIFRRRTPFPPAPSPDGPAAQSRPLSLPQKPELKPERVAAQKAIDAALVPVIKKTPLMDGYLKTLFSLSKCDVPHKMQF